jgi:hypothetical protein
VGDELLRAVAGRLRSSVRETDTVARFGGDEFAVMSTNIRQTTDAAALGDKLIKALGDPFSIQGNDIRIGTSIGIAVYSPEIPDAETLLSHADVALYRAKAEGRGAYRFFTDAMDTEIRARVTLLAELRDAIISGQLFADIAILRAQQSSRSPAPKKLDYTWEPWDTRDGTWQAAKQSGSLSLMPHDELRRYSHVYAVLAAFMDALPAFGTRMEVARAIAQRAPDGNLSSRDSEELISATSEAQGRLALLSRLLHYAKDGLQDLSHQ